MTSPDLRSRPPRASVVGIAHDLDRTLTAIGAAAALLERDLRERPALRALAAQIFDASDAASAIAQAILVSARTGQRP